MSSRSRAALDAEMGLAMRRFMANVVVFQDAVAKSAGLNSVDLQCVGLLMLDGPSTPSELARRTGLGSGGAITAVIDRLEAAGLVRRVRDAADRRRVLVTPEVEELRRRVAPAYERVGAEWGAYLATLDDDQVAFLTAAFQRATAINRDEVAALREV